MTTIKAIERELRAKRVVLCRSGRGWYTMYRDAEDIGVVVSHPDDRRHCVHLFNPDYYTSIFSIAELRTLILPKLC